MTDNGNQPDTITISRELMQQMIDYLSRCPAGDVWMILRRLEDEQAEQAITETIE